MTLFKKSILVFTIVSLCFGTQSYSQKGFLYQAAYNGSAYEFGYNSMAKIPIVNAPEDVDWNRWSMLYDGEYRLFFMPKGRSNTLYQFGYNASTQSYEYGYKNTYTIPIVGLPDRTDISSFSMLYDGTDYRLYFSSMYDNAKLLQCGYNADRGESGSFVYGYRSIGEIPIRNAPSDTDWSRWGMLHDGSVYRLYFTPIGSDDVLYQFGFDGKSYKYGYSSDPRINVDKMPETYNVPKFNMLHDGRYYRFYRLKKPIFKL